MIEKEKNDTMKKNEENEGARIIDIICLSFVTIIMNYICSIDIKDVQISGIPGLYEIIKYGIKYCNYLYLDTVFLLITIYAIFDYVRHHYLKHKKKLENNIDNEDSEEKIEDVVENFNKNKITHILEGKWWIAIIGIVLTAVFVFAIVWGVTFYENIDYNIIDLIEKSSRESDKNESEYIYDDYQAIYENDSQTIYNDEISDEWEMSDESDRFIEEVPVRNDVFNEDLYRNMLDNIYLDLCQGNFYLPYNMSEGSILGVEDVGYTFYNLDGKGPYELLIVPSDTYSAKSPGEVYIVYTVKNQSVCELSRGAYSDFWYVCKTDYPTEGMENHLYLEEINFQASVQCGSYRYWYLSEGELSCMCNISYDAMERPNDPWMVGNTLCTETDVKEYMDQYVAVDLESTPFSQYEY